MPRRTLTALQESELTSFRSSQTHVAANISIIEGIASFLANYNKIKNNITAIDAAVELKSATMTGIAAGKKTNRQTMSEQTVIVAGLVRGYAEDTGNERLRAEMDIKPSRLTRTRDEEIAPLCQLVHDRAVSEIPAEMLKDHNLSAEKLAALQTAIDNYRAEIASPRTALSTRKNTTAEIAALFEETKTLYTRFDAQILSLKADHPTFVNTYFHTREFFNPPTRPKPADTEEGSTPATEGDNNPPA